MRLKKRLMLIVAGLLVAHSLLIARYYMIQVIEGEKWALEALNQHEFKVKEPFRRGTFFANTSMRGDCSEAQPLAVDITKFHLCLDANAVPENHKHIIAEILFSLIGRDVDFQEMEKCFFKKSRYKKLFLWLDKEERDRVLAWWRPYSRQYKIPGNAIFFVTDYQRSYPFGKMLGQALHSIREVKDESTGKSFPTGGLEAYFNDILEGEFGERKLLRSPLNHMDIDRVLSLPKDGSDIYLTINPYIQSIAEDELAKGVKLSQAKGGRVIIMNPHTGEILALAQYPFFEPFAYKEYFNDEEKIEYTKVTSITDAFEPGSIMKPITVALALTANEELEKLGKRKIFETQEPIDVTRSIFPGRAKYPLRDISRNTKLNMYMAIQKSSNVYMAQLAERIVCSLGDEWYREYLSNLGFGQKTRIELPAEAVGLLPSLNKYNANGSPEWSKSTPYSLAMGYNILSTSLQVIRAYASLANGGYIIKPTLVRKIVYSNGKESTFTLPQEKYRVFSEEVVKEVVKAMRFTTCIGGSGFRASLKRYSTAGKTGTTEKIIQGKYCKNRHIASFIGMTPADHKGRVPAAFVMLVSIDDPAYLRLPDGTKNYMGGRWAAKVFASIAEKTLEYLGIPYDDENNSFQDELITLRTLYNEWNRS